MQDGVLFSQDRVSVMESKELKLRSNRKGYSKLLRRSSSQEWREQCFGVIGLLGVSQRVRSSSSELP